MIDLTCPCNMKLWSEKTCLSPKALFIVRICEPELVLENETVHMARGAHRKAALTQN